MGSPVTMTQTIDLPSLVSGLEALLASLEAADQAWVDRFRNEWWTLEQVYAVALDRGQTELSAEEASEIAKTIAKMKPLLADRVAVHADQDS